MGSCKAEKDTADLTTATKMIEPTEQPSDIPSLFVEDDVLLPNTYSSLPNPLESSTSKESPWMDSRA